jgi:putative membrane protein
MGVADVVPGVSGGTVAFITGIYDELLHSIKAVDLEAMKLFRKFEFAAFWKKINGNFLIVLLAGIATSLISLARMLTYLLRYQPILVRSFFFGVILISALLVLREIRKWNGLAVLSILIGTGIGYGITLLPPIQSPQNFVFIFFAGALAVCAMIVPGISWMFTLMLLGMYQYIVKAVTELNIAVIIVFITGSLIGVVGFSRILSWIFDNYHSTTVALLAGLMFGSLNKVWPWREVLEYVANNKAEQVPVFDKSILPWNYLTTTGKDPQVFQAILLIALGVFIVVLIERISTRLKTKI